MSKFDKRNVKAFLLIDGNLTDLLLKDVIRS